MGAPGPGRRTGLTDTRRSHIRTACFRTAALGVALTVLCAAPAGAGEIRAAVELPAAETGAVLSKEALGSPAIGKGSGVSLGLGGVPAELERIAQCESNGDYGAVNPSSGARGKFQILPSTAAAHGCDLSTPAGQDACAVKIWAGGAGRGQWVC